MNRQIIGVVIYRSLRYEKICYSVTNIVLLLFLSILFPYIYPGLNFIQVGAKKQYIYRYCFLIDFFNFVTIKCDIL